MLRVLIIEDEQVNREFLRLALRGQAQCVAVPTGEEGLREHRRALARSEPFEVLFLDLMLPGMDGLKTLELLRAAEDEQELPAEMRLQVLVTTVLDDDRTAQRAFIQGQAAAFMTKPFCARQISDELSKLGLL